MVDDDGIYRIYEPNTKDYNPDKEVTVMDPLSVPHLVIRLVNILLLSLNIMTKVN